MLRWGVAEGGVFGDGMGLKDQLVVEHHPSNAQFALFWSTVREYEPGAGFILGEISRMMTASRRFKVKNSHNLKKME